MFELPKVEIINLEMDDIVTESPSCTIECKTQD